MRFSDHVPAWRSAFWMATYLTAGLLLASVTAVGLVALAPHMDESTGALLLRKGPEAVVRRSALFWLVVLLPAFLSACGWKGWKDIGITRTEDPRPGREAGRKFFLGLLIGVISLGLLALIACFAGVRFLVPADQRHRLFLHLARFALSAMVVGMAEELIARGMLFRTLARSWTAWPAALITSLLFAEAHFLQSDPAAFEQKNFWGAAWETARSSLASLPYAAHFGIRFMNLFLLGLVLCAFVIRTGTIWLSAGAHAGWVLVMRVNGYLTDITREVPWSPLLGQRGDTTDAVLTSILLLMLLLGTLSLPWYTSKPVYSRNALV